MFVDTMLDDVPKISRFHSLSFPSAPSTPCRVFFRAFSAVKMRGQEKTKVSMTWRQRNKYYKLFIVRVIIDTC